MKRLVATLLLFSFSFIFLLAGNINSANKPVKTKHTGKTLSTVYSFPDEQAHAPSIKSSERIPLSQFDSFQRSPSTSQSPGVVVGYTWYDHQQNTRMGRMIDWTPYNGYEPDGPGEVIFSYMYLPEPNYYGRKYEYSDYNIATGTLSDPIKTHYWLTDPGVFYSGYVQLDAAKDYGAALGGHSHPYATGFTMSKIYVIPQGDFVYNRPDPVVLPDSIAAYGIGNPGEVEMMWPTIAYQFGTDTIIHVLAQQYNQSYGTNNQAIGYFRRTGTIFSDGTWDYPPYIVDTVDGISQIVVADRNSDKVALIWSANLPLEGDCDTCSHTNTISSLESEWNNDLYYQISYDQGLSWEPRVNLTQYEVNDRYRSSHDISAMFDTESNLHIIWSASVWENNETDQQRSRLFHWSENTPYLRTVNVEESLAPVCGQDVRTLNIGKIQISQCNGKLYALWMQAFDIVEERIDDCSSGPHSSGFGNGNGDLYVSVSADNGLTWDAPRNITNTYSPNCDPTTGYDCESENWPSMVRHGREIQAGDDWSGAAIVDPSGSYAGNSYLDIQYILDKDAGSIVYSHGTWQIAELRWMRLACVDPVLIGPISPAIYPWGIYFPTKTEPGIQLDTTLTISNHSNTSFDYSITINELNGTSGWLGLSQTSGSIPAGLNNVEQLTLYLNYNGVQTTPANLEGQLIITSNALSSPDTFFVNLAVVNYLTEPKYDTLFTSCLALTYANSGNMGNQGIGGANLDFVKPDSSGPDCTITVPAAPLADVYLNDGSTVLGWIDGVDTIMNHSMYGTNYVHDNGLVPIGLTNSNTANATYDIYSSGAFASHDSTIGMNSYYIVPKDAECNWIIKALKVWSHDGVDHSGLLVGEVYDWDIPTDSGADNSSSLEFAAQSLIYQQGMEYNQDDTTASGAQLECQDNDLRYGGVGYIKTQNSGVDVIDIPYSINVGNSEDDTYPTGNFVAPELYKLMSNSEWSIHGIESDQYMTISYDNDLTITSSDNYIFYSVLITVKNGNSADVLAAYNSAKAWFTANHVPDIIASKDTDGDGALDSFDNCRSTWNPNQLDLDGDGQGDICPGCCKNYRGNINGSPDDAMDISDIVYFVDYFFNDGDEPPCMDEADVNGDGTIDISDIVCQIDYALVNPSVCFPALCPE